jgi:hypothetical protein
VSNESAIRVAAKLYERRDMARQMFGGDYQKHVDAATVFIREQMAKWGKGLMPTVLDILKCLDAKNDMDGGFASLAVCAAAVDMAEPERETR